MGVFSPVGFSGSRSWVVARRWWRLLSSLVPSCPSVVVGCAGGVDALVRSLALRSRVPLRVFRAGSRSRFALRRRSERLVSFLARSGGVLVAFPSSPCPSGLSPATARGPWFGSGTWGSVCFAVSLGVPVVVFLPPSVRPPSWGRWLRLSCGGWLLLEVRDGSGLF